MIPKEFLPDITPKEYYSCNNDGKKCVCNHKHYCIWSNERRTLEKDIGLLRESLYGLIQQKKMIKKGDYYVSKTLESTEWKIHIIEKDYIELLKIQEKMIKGD